MPHRVAIIASSPVSAAVDKMKMRAYWGVRSAMVSNYASIARFELRRLCFVNLLLLLLLLLGTG